MRPPRALPLTWPRSTPSSRANRRTAGLACGTLPGIRASASKVTGGECGLPAFMAGVEGWAGPDLGSGSDLGSGLASGAASALGSGFSSVFCAGLASAFADGLSAASAAGSISATTEPSDSSSPTFTFTSRTTPSKGAGTSIVALSDSSVTRPWSLLTVSPGLTSTSITGTSLSSPISGTRASLSSAMVHLGLLNGGFSIVPRLAPKKTPRGMPGGLGQR